MSCTFKYVKINLSVLSWDRRVCSCYNQRFISGMSSNVSVRTKNTFLNISWLSQKIKFAETFAGGTLSLSVCDQLIKLDFSSSVCSSPPLLFLPSPQNWNDLPTPIRTTQSLWVSEAENSSVQEVPHVLVFFLLNHPPGSSFFALSTVLQQQNKKPSSLQRWCFEFLSLSFNNTPRPSDLYSVFLRTESTRFLYCQMILDLDLKKTSNTH